MTTLIIVGVCFGIAALRRASHGDLYLLVVFALCAAVYVAVVLADRVSGRE